MQLKDKLAIVVGGGSGMGRATAELLTKEAVRVAVLDLPNSHGRKVAEIIGGHFVPCDISDHVGTEAAVNLAVEALGGLHIGVNVAGGGSLTRRVIDADGPYPLAEFQRAVELNLIASFNLDRMEAWHMRLNEPEDGERGVIINCSSIAAFGGPVGLVQYSASKAGVAGLSMGMARDLAPYGIRCMAIAPGLFETGLITNMSESQKASLVTEAVFPKRPGRPHEFALMVRSIVENQMLNGETIRLDAGTRRAVQDNLGDRLF